MDRIHEVDLSVLSPYPDGRPVNDSRVKEIMCDWSILSDPMLVNRKNQVLDGVHRLEAHRRLKHTSVLVIYIEPKTTEYRVL